MAFTPELKKQINAYISVHVAEADWHTDYFSFISDSALALRLGEEFISTRYIYKLLEGLEAEDWLLRAQIRTQILSYASIYEAALHHILFDDLSANPLVQALLEGMTYKHITLPKHNLAKLDKLLEHDGKTVLPMYKTVSKIDETKIRFDKKAECAEKLGLIDAGLRDELIEFYEARNAIHIHAEIRKGLSYELDLSKRAYRRLMPFKDQITRWLAKYHSISTLTTNPPSAQSPAPQSPE